jgi:uncharacterized coiled-coil DUF342 family protein
MAISFIRKSQVEELRMEIVRLKLEIAKLQNELTDIKRERDRLYHRAYSAGFEDARSQYPFGESL